MASIAVTLVARRQGIHADINTVAAAITAANSTESHDICKFTLYGEDIILLNLSPTHKNVIHIPIIPTTMPIGMPITDTAVASKRMERFIWRLVAPIDVKSPNWRVRSETDMENALYISAIEPSSIRNMNIPPRE